MGKTNIQWTDLSWNIARGCTMVDSDCDFCYMYRDSFNGTRYKPGVVTKTKTVFDMPLKYKETKSKVWEGRPLIFTSSLTDFFHEKCDPFRDEAEAIIDKCPDKIFQILTKRPERIPYDFGWRHKNTWLGTSVGSIAGVERIKDIINKQAMVRFVSFEPLHEDVTQHPDLFELLRCIQWVIIGGESGNDTGKFRYRPCHTKWIESLKNMAKAAGCAVFIKQMGTHISKHSIPKMSDRHGGNIDEFLPELRIREFPKVYK